MKAQNLFQENNQKGKNKCFFCGDFCGDKYTTKTYVKKTFMNRDICAFPFSKFVCVSCVSCFSENTLIRLCDGEIREKQRIRTYSWVIEEKNKTAYTKKHIKELREKILNPPEPPFVIILADSGQKHLIFRAKVNLEKDNFYVSLEEDIIKVNIEKLKYYLNACIPLIAACGKILIKQFEYNLCSISILIEKMFRGETENIINNFLKCSDKQLLKLAVWLSFNKEESIKYLNKEE